jgi:hypothetical protein
MRTWRFSFGSTSPIEHELLVSSLSWLNFRMVQTQEAALLSLDSRLGWRQNPWTLARLLRVLVQSRCQYTCVYWPWSDERLVRTIRRMRCVLSMIRQREERTHE